MLRNVWPPSRPARGACRWMSIGSKLREKNAAWRERSEAALEERRNALGGDWKKHQHGIGELRDAIRNKEPFTIHPPPAALYPSDKAFYFPSLEVRALRGGTRKLDPSDLFKGELSLMGCAGSRFSEAMVNAWLDGVAGTSGAAGAAIEGDRAKGEGDHILGAGGVSEAAAAAVCDTGGSIGGGSAPSVRILRLALVEGAILSWLRLPLLASMRVTVPAAQRDSFFVCFGDTTEMRRKLRFTNRYLGYVCVVDSAGVVRWHVHSSEIPTDQQIQALRRCLR